MCCMHQNCHLQTLFERHKHEFEHLQHEANWGLVLCIKLKLACDSNARNYIEQFDVNTP